MVRKTTRVGETLYSANLNTQQAREAIPQLQRRLKEFNGFLATPVQSDVGDNIIKSLEDKINSTVVSIYGVDSLETKRLSAKNLQCLPSVYFAGMDRSFSARYNNIKVAVSACASKIKTEIDLLEERIGAGDEDSTSRSIRAYEGLTLHNDVAKASSSLFKTGHYAEAVEAAVKALNNLVRYKSGLTLDGVKLMEQTFSPNNPLLKFNELADASDKDEQRGYMMLFSGAVTGIRNPRAHTLKTDAPERALEFIAFISLLAKLAEDANN